MSVKKTFVFGLHSVQNLMERQAKSIVKLCVQSSRQDKKIMAVVQLAKAQHISVEWVDKNYLDNLTQLANHQGILAFCEDKPAYQENDLPNLLEHLPKPNLLLILDGVQDPHNLGACFRSADAAGVQAIITPKHHSVGITPVVSKVACGAAESVPFIQVTNLVRTMELLKENGIWLYGAAAEAPQTLYQTDLTASLAIVMGAEGSGLRRLTRDSCDELISIPLRGQVSSLNVSVATGICLFEVIRQRITKTT